MAECFLKRTIIQSGASPELYISLDASAFSTSIKYSGKILNVNILSTILRAGFIDGSLEFSPKNIILSSAGSDLYIQNYAFNNLSDTLTYDFSQFSFVPTLQSANAFYNINPAAQILVPASLYNTWRTAQYWSSYQSQIVSN